MTNANVTLSPYERAVNILNELTSRQDTIISTALNTLRTALATAEAEIETLKNERRGLLGLVRAELEGPEKAQTPLLDLAKQRMATLARLKQERDQWKAAANTRSAEVNTWMRDAHEAQAALTEARRVLRVVEWGGGDWCPCCGMMQRDGHRDGCALAAVLAQEEK